jgi:hypothetical protein
MLTTSLQIPAGARIVLRTAGRRRLEAGPDELVVHTDKPSELLVTYEDRKA